MERFFSAEELEGINEIVTLANELRTEVAVAKEKGSKISAYTSFDLTFPRTTPQIHVRVYDNLSVDLLSVSYDDALRHINDVREVFTRAMEIVRKDFRKARIEALKKELSDLESEEE